MRILLVDDQPLFLDSLRGAMRSVDGVEHVATASDGRAAAELFFTEKCNICLIEVASRRIDRDAAITGIFERDPGAKIVALTIQADEQLVIEMVLRGLKGYLLKQTLVSDLVRALRRVHEGFEVYAPEAVGIVTSRLRSVMLAYPGANGNGVYYDAGSAPGSVAGIGEAAAEFAAAALPLQNEELNRLSEREREILMLVADGISNRQIASIVHVTEGTIKNHVSNILRKLRLSNRSELVAYAWKFGLKNMEVAAAGDRHSAAGA